MTGWDTDATAAAYGRVVAAHDCYAATGRDLVELVAPADAGVLVDVACGTGIVTAELLAVASPDATVVGVDSSAAMLAEAARRVTDRRVRWVQSDANRLGDHVPSAAAVVCSGGLWMGGLANVVARLAAVLAPGGRLAFNLPAPARDDEPDGPMLLAQFVAWRAAPAHEVARRRPRPGPDQLRSWCESAGLVVEHLAIRTYERSAEAQRDMLAVPVFADSVLPGLPAAVQQALIDEEFERWSPRRCHTNLLVASAARPPSL